MATTPKHYLRAPITEAVIDICIGAVSPETLKIDTLSEQFAGYKKKGVQHQLSVTVGPEVPAESSKKTNGYYFKSDDGRYIAQVKVNGFTLSRLAPYDRWETFSAEAKRLWTIYRDVVGHLTITRAAVRYVNRVEIPQPVGDFGQYFQAVPSVTSGMFGEVTGFFVQLQVPQPDLQSMLWFNEAIVPPSSEKVVAVLLDFDLFREQDLPQSEEDLWSLFEKFRQRKNDLFEACVTDKARELFQ